MLDHTTNRTGTQPQPTIRDLAAVLFRQRSIFGCAALLISAGIAFYAVAGSKYQAQMEILVRHGRADSPVTDQETAPIDMTRLAVTEEEINSEVELLRDDEILRRVVEANGLEHHDWLKFLRPGEDRSTRVERGARRLAQKLKIEPIKKTNLIAVSYDSADPALAAAVLRSLATNYLLKHTEVHRPDGELPFFSQEEHDSQVRLGVAQQNLLRFMAAHNVVAAGQERDLTLQRLSEADASYRQSRIELQQTASRVEELKQLLKALPERIVTQVRTADNPELFKALKSTLLDLEIKRTHLLTEFEPSHRLVREVDEQIKQAKTAIATESLNPVRDEVSDRNPRYDWAKAELERSQVEVKGLEARALATGNEVEQYRTIAHQLGESAIEQDDLVATQRTALESHTLYMKKREGARMEDALDQHGIVNVAIAEHPIAPLLPVWSGWTLCLIGLAAAGSAGTAAAFAADHFDPAFRTPEEVLGYLNLPVLASLPTRSARALLTDWREES